MSLVISIPYCTSLTSQPRVQENQTKCSCCRRRWTTLPGMRGRFPKSVSSASLILESPLSFVPIVTKRTPLSTDHSIFSSSPLTSISVLTFYAGKPKHGLLRSPSTTTLPFTKYKTIIVQHLTHPTPHLHHHYP